MGSPSGCGLGSFVSYDEPHRMLQAVEADSTSCERPMAFERVEAVRGTWYVRSAGCNLSSKRICRGQPVGRESSQCNEVTTSRAHSRERVPTEKSAGIQNKRRSNRENRNVHHPETTLTSVGSLRFRTSEARWPERCAHVCGRVERAAGSGPSWPRIPAGSLTRHGWFCRFDDIPLPTKVKLVVQKVLRNVEIFVLVCFSVVRIFE